jgi:hypothetical protein
MTFPLLPVSFIKHGNGTSLSIGEKFTNGVENLFFFRGRSYTIIKTDTAKDTYTDGPVDPAESAGKVAALFALTITVVGILFLGIFVLTHRYQQRQHLLAIDSRIKKEKESKEQEVRGGQEAQVTTPIPDKSKDLLTTQKEKEPSTLTQEPSTLTQEPSAPIQEPSTLTEDIIVEQESDVKKTQEDLNLEKINESRSKNGAFKFLMTPGTPVASYWNNTGSREYSHYRYITKRDGNFYALISQHKLDEIESERFELYKLSELLTSIAEENRGRNYTNKSYYTLMAEPSKEWTYWTEGLQYTPSFIIVPQQKENEIAIILPSKTGSFTETVITGASDEEIFSNVMSFLVTNELIGE